MHQRHVISLLIHGFLSVNARLLIAFGTPFLYNIETLTNDTISFEQLGPGKKKQMVKYGQCCLVHSKCIFLFRGRNVKGKI